MTKWTLTDPPSRDELEKYIEELETYIERLEQTIKNMTAHIRVDTDG